MQQVSITIREEYDYAIMRGYQPLVNPLFDLDIDLRICIQDEIFDRNAHGKHTKFYNWIKKYKEWRCEESGHEIYELYSFNISHILSKGCSPEMKNDPRNVNILLRYYHNIWEYGTESEKKKLNIWSANQDRIIMLKKEYSKRNLYRV